MTLAAVVIGRNEGQRLIRCLAALDGQAAPVVYVDSGSTDGSVAAARAAGVAVVELDMTTPFTAARARNAGLDHLAKIPAPEYVQVIDGDCELCAGWTETARAFLDTHPDVAIVAGRLRERFPEASIWNRLADAEWDTATGETEAVGGIAVLRFAAISEVGGYRGELIAGEEPELCLRLRRTGWRIWRLDSEMAWHDIAMTRFSQWWRRARRHGHAIAKGAALHGDGPERYCVRQVRRALIWGVGIPLAAVLGAVLVSPVALALLLAWPAQVWRLKRRGMDWSEALFTTLIKLPEAQGILGYHLGRLAGTGPRLIEYK
jgi:GT2 family glycosyltransferase